MYPIHWHPGWRTIKRHRRSQVFQLYLFYTSAPPKEKSSDAKLSLFNTPPKKITCNTTKATFVLPKGTVSCFIPCRGAHGAWTFRKVSRIREDLEVVLRRHKFLGHQVVFCIGWWGSVRDWFGTPGPTPQKKDGVLVLVVFFLGTNFMLCKDTILIDMRGLSGFIFLKITSEVEDGWVFE